MPSVLVACEFSGRARDAFAARGFEAWSCDYLPSETNVGGVISSLTTPIKLDIILVEIKRRIKTNGS